MTRFNDFQLVKRSFFALRNGVVADTLRKGGSPFRIIFGLNLPQISEIARGMKQDFDMALKLWDNRTTRESMLLAPMVMPIAKMTGDLADKWISEAPCVEVIDILCLKLLRHLDFAWSIVESNIDSENDMRRYAAVRLMWNLIPSHSVLIRPLALKEAERHNGVTEFAARTLVDEIDFLNGQ